MSLTRAIQIFPFQNRHMALGSTNARFLWHPFLKETERELYLGASSPPPPTWSDSGRGNITRPQNPLYLGHRQMD